MRGVAGDRARRHHTRSRVDDADPIAPIGGYLGVKNICLRTVYHDPIDLVRRDHRFTIDGHLSTVHHPDPILGVLTDAGTRHYPGCRVDHQSIGPVSRDLCLLSKRDT